MRNIRVCIGLKKMNLNDLLVIFYSICVAVMSTAYLALHKLCYPTCFTSSMRMFRRAALCSLFLFYFGFKEE